MSGMSAADTEAFAAGIEGLRAAYPMLTPEMLSETVRAVLGSAGPVIRADERGQLFDLLGHDHYVIFTADGFTTEHSIECRLSGHMHECATHSAIGGYYGHAPQPAMLGRWRVVSTDGDWPELECTDAGDES